MTTTLAAEMMDLARELGLCAGCARPLVAVPVLSRHGASAGPHNWLWRCQVCPSEVVA